MKKITFLLAILFASAVSFAQVKDSVNKPCPPCPQMLPIELPTQQPTPFFNPAPQKGKGMTTRPNSYTSTITGSLNNTTNNNYYGCQQYPGQKSTKCGESYYGYGHHHGGNIGWDPGSMLIFFVLLAALIAFIMWLRRNDPPASVAHTHTHTHNYPPAPKPEVKESASAVKEYPKPVKPAVDLAGMSDEFKSTGATVEVKPDGGVIVTIPKSEPAVEGKKEEKK